MPPTGLTRAASSASVLLVLLLLVSCGGGGDGGDGARPTVSPTRTPTATLPSPDLPSPTRSPTRADGTDEPTTEETSTPEQDPAPESASPGTPESAAEGSAEDEGVPPWVWLVAAIVLVGAVAIPLVMRARRRSAWRQDLADVEGELTWFARSLLPELRHAGSREQVAGGWTVGQTRVAAAEDRLTLLESTAPDDAGRERARSLRDASRLARTRMQQLTGPGPHETWALDLDSIIADLEVALGERRVASPG